MLSAKCQNESSISAEYQQSSTLRNHLDLEKVIIFPKAFHNLYSPNTKYFLTYLAGPIRGIEV